MTTAREYLRVSQDRSGRLRSNHEQHDDHVKLAAERGVQLGEPYSDDVSASRYSRKTREGFPLLLADLKSGGFGADELWIWESSRGGRTVKEWTALVDVCDTAGVRIHVTTHQRTYDPRNPRDRRSLLEDAIDAEYESGKASQRIKRAAAASAALGRPHGRTPYGYRRTYDPATGRMTGQVPEPAEAKVVARLYEMLQQGHTLNMIARTFEEEGIRSRNGTVFRHNHLRGIALNATYAALRVHAPGIEKHPTLRALPGPGVAFTEGIWPALVNRSTYHAVVAKLTDPARTTRKPGGAKHLLSGIGACDALGEPLSVTTRRSIGSAYQCLSGCIVVPQAPLDEIAEAVMLGYLARPDVRAQITAASQESPALRAVRNTLAAARARLAEVYASAGAVGGISAAALATIEPRILAEIQKLEAQEAALAPSGALAPFVSPGADAAARWAAAPITVRREVARLLLAPGRLGQLRIKPRPAGWPPFVPVPVQDRLAWLGAGGA